MKPPSGLTRRALALALLIPTLTVLTSPSEAQQGRPIDLVDSPFPPYVEGEHGGPPTGGLAVRLVDALGARIGREFRITLHPWKRLLKMLRLGQADGVTLILRTAEREEYLRYTIVLLESRESLYYSSERLEDFQWRTFRDLEGYRIGLVDGYTYGEPFLQGVSALDLRVEYANDDAANFRKLVEGRVDLVLADDAVASSLLASHPSWREVVERAEQPVAVYPYHMAFSRKSPAADLVPGINRAIESMREDGTLATILSSFR